MIDVEQFLPSPFRHLLAFFGREQKIHTAVVGVFLFEVLTSCAHEALCLLAAASATQEAGVRRTWYRVLSRYGELYWFSVDRELIDRKP